MLPVVMGLFGIAELLENPEKGFRRDIFKTSISQLFPNREDWKLSMGPIARGTILGFFLGLLPGGGALISSFTSYAIEKRISKHPERFGSGAIEGVTGPESANNSATGGAFIPLLTFGFPASVVMALVLGALRIHGIQPGSLLMRHHPNLFWGCGGQHVYWQHHAPGPKPPIDSHLGKDPEDPLSSIISFDSSLLFDRCIQFKQ